MTKEFYFIVYEEDSEEYCQVVKKSDNLERIKEYAELIKQTRNNVIAIIRGVFIELDYIDDLKEEDFENLKDEIKYEKEREERNKKLYEWLKQEKNKNN